MKRVFHLNIITLLLLLACNKGEFDSSLCEDCPDRMACYDGICDCDTSYTFKMWNRCQLKSPSKYINYAGDSSIGITGLIVDSISYSSSLDWYTYDLWFDEPEKHAFGFPSPTNYPEEFTARIVPKSGYDSIYMNAWTYYYYRNGLSYQFRIFGKSYQQDSMKLRIFLQDPRTYQFVDSSAVISVLR